MSDNTICIIVVFVLFILIILAYNKGITLRNYVNEAFSTMDVYLKKRWDLIPNLVSAVKGYASYEKDVLAEITELRNKSYNDMDNSQKIDINTKISYGLGKLIAVVENYPELKANNNFLTLMQKLTDVENDIANARKYYNGSVRIYNNFTEMFPTNIIAKLFNFKQAEMFSIDNEERESIQIGLR